MSKIFQKKLILNLIISKNCTFLEIFCLFKYIDSPIAESAGHSYDEVA